MCQMHSELMIWTKCVFLADEAFKFVSGQFAKLEMPRQRLLLDKSFLAVPTPEAGVFTAHMFVKRFHGPEELLAVAALCELDDVLGSNVVNSIVSARKFSAAAGNHSSIIRMPLLIMHKETWEGFKVSFANFASDFAVISHHFVSFSMQFRFGTFSCFLHHEILINIAWLIAFHYHRHFTLLFRRIRTCFVFMIHEQLIDAVIMICILFVTTSLYLDAIFIDNQLSFLDLWKWRDEDAFWRILDLLFRLIFDALAQLLVCLGNCIKFIEILDYVEAFLANFLIQNLKLKFVLF